MTNIQRVGMINSNNTQRNSDHDFTKLWKWALGNQGGVESKGQFVFDNDTKKLLSGSDIATAYILCTRPASNPIPNQKFLAQFEFTGSLDFLNITNGDKIFIEIKENLVKDPTLIEDLDSQTSYNQGLGIGEIKMAKNYPSHSNYLKLYEWNEGKLLDLRKAISLPAVESVAQRTSTLEEKLSTAEGQISQLVEAGTPSYLGITAIVGEKYTMEDTLFLQKTPTLADSTIAINVGDTNANKEQHIQRISSGESSNQLKLKMDKFGAPTTNVIVEVRKGVKVDVSEKEAYWYGGDELLASASLPYTAFQTEAQEITVNLNQAFQLPKGELYSIVVKQENGIVNASNYYRLYCDSTQYSEAFSGVFVNGGERARHQLMPYCISEAFFTELLVKEKKETYKAKIIENEAVISGNKATFANSVKGKNVVFDITFASPVTSVYLWEKLENGGLPRERINVNNGKLEKTKENCQSIGHFGFSNSSSSLDSSPYNIASGKVYTYKEVSLVHSVYQQVGYVEGRHSLGEKVKFILFGVVNGVWYNDRRSLIVNKTISGDASAERIAPSAGFIQCCWLSGVITSGRSRVSLNQKELGWGDGEQRGLFFVPKGIVTLRCWNNRGPTPKITIEEFIPL